VFRKLSNAIQKFLFSYLSLTHILQYSQLKKPAAHTKKELCEPLKKLDREPVPLKKNV
jgi:hypothetical protein